MRFQLSRVERRSAARRLCSALLNDLDNDVAYAQGREVKTILLAVVRRACFPARRCKRCWRRTCAFAAGSGCRNYDGSESGTVEADRFVDYQRAGVNRISLAYRVLAKKS